MSRMEGVDPRNAGLFTRLVFWLAKRKLREITGTARLVEPLKITAHHPRLMIAYGQMEMGQAAARSVPESLKILAALKCATLIGCPF